MIGPGSASPATVGQSDGPAVPPIFRLLCPLGLVRPIDSGPTVRQFPGVKKKPQQVGETAPPYTAKKTVKGKVAAPVTDAEKRQADDAAFNKVADKIFSERKDLLRKLAQ